MRGVCIADAQCRSQIKWLLPVAAVDMRIDRHINGLPLEKLHICTDWPSHETTRGCQQDYNQHGFNNDRFGHITASLPNLNAIDVRMWLRLSDWLYVPASIGKINRVATVTNFPIPTRYAQKP